MPIKIEVPKVETEAMITKDLQLRYEALLGSTEAVNCSGRSSSAGFYRSRCLCGATLSLTQEPESQVAALEQMAPSEPQPCTGKPLRCLHSQVIPEVLPLKEGKTE